MCSRWKVFKVFKIWRSSPTLRHKSSNTSWSGQIQVLRVTLPAWIALLPPRLHSFFMKIWLIAQASQQLRLSHGFGWRRNKYSTSSIPSAERLQTRALTQKMHTCSSITMKSTGHTWKRALSRLQRCFRQLAPLRKACCIRTIGHRWASGTT